jgi:hypothetical protein
MDNLFDFLKKDVKNEETEILKVDDNNNKDNKDKKNNKYDQNKYNKNFMEKNKDKIKEKIICDICCGTYTYFNKSKHFKSSKHIKIMNKYCSKRILKVI